MTRLKHWFLVTGVVTVLAVLGGYLTWQEPQPVKVEGVRGALARRFAGSSSCRACHAAEFEAWQSSHHALAERPIDMLHDRPAFEPGTTVIHGSISSDVRLREGHPEIETVGADGKRNAYRPQRVIGVAPLEQFLVPAPGGRWQAMSLAHDRKRNEWFDVFGQDDRKPQEWGFWANRGLTWNSMCASCHVTNLRKGYQPESDTYHTEWLELGVGCEACHGPRAAHVEEAQRSPESVRQRAAALGKQSPDLILDTCGSCHARRVELTGAFQAGERFLDHYRPVLPDESTVYYPDGQVHDENFEHVSFLLSRMHGEGVRCGNCHDPHSARLRLQGNALCLQCHQGKIDPASHSHHDPASPGGQCVNCHMPLTTYMERHPRRDHGFTIPDPLLTKEWGIPNACNRCHHDRSVDWAVAAAEKWFGSRLDRSTRDRARIIAKARLGLGSNVPDLLQLIVREKGAAWRATAVGFTSAWVNHPLVRPVLSTLLLDPEALVRAAAARALGQASDERDDVKPLLDDVSRLVRIEAAWVLRKSLELSSLAGKDLLQHLEQVADQPQGALQRSVFLLDRGDATGAETHIRQAMRWDATTAPYRQALALALDAQGDAKGAIAALEEAVRLAPLDAEYPFALALAHAGRDDHREAIRALERAVELDPRFARAWYNLGLARSRIGLAAPAIEALQRAQKEDPNSPEYPFARATIHWHRREYQEARQAAQESLGVDPEFEPAIELMTEIAALEG